MLSKTDLRNAIASKNRGITATLADQQAIASIIARVEDLNPTPDPLSATELLTGDWRLLYTTSKELLGINNVPIAKLGDIYQCVRPKEARIYNIAEIKGIPYLEGIISVVASFTPAETAVESATTATTSAGNTSQDAQSKDIQKTSQSVSSGSSTAVAGIVKNRVNVKFNRAIIGLQRILGYHSPAQYIEKLETTTKFNPLQGIDFAINAERQQGWLEITYLDEDLRIGRGNQGSLFVLTKDQV